MFFLNELLRKSLHTFISDFKSSSNNHYLCVPRYACQNVCRFTVENSIYMLSIELSLKSFAFFYNNLLKI